MASVLGLGATACSQDDVERAATSNQEQGAAPAKGVGVFMGGGDAEEIADFEQWMGGEISHALAFLGRKSWDGFVNRELIQEWAGSGYRMVYGTPMLMESGGTLRQGADGAFDEHFRELAQTLVENGQGNAILRLGWEFDGDWYPWSSQKDPQAFVDYWRRIVDTMRAVPGAEKLEFDWNSSSGGQGPLEEVYPGDEYVDYIGLDLYDRSYTPEDKLPVARWELFMTRPGGLNWARDFAKAHGKPMSIPEWGLTTQHSSGAKQDNPDFVRNMHEFIQANDIGYQSYFEMDAHDGDFRLRSGQFPEAAKVYQELF